MSSPTSARRRLRTFNQLSWSALGIFLFDPTRWVETDSGCSAGGVSHLRAGQDTTSLKGKDSVVGRFGGRRRDTAPHAASTRGRGRCASAAERSWGATTAAWKRGCVTQHRIIGNHSTETRNDGGGIEICERPPSNRSSPWSYHDVPPRNLRAVALPFTCATFQPAPEHDITVGTRRFGVSERLNSMRRGKEQPFSSADELDVKPFTGVARWIPRANQKYTDGLNRQSDSHWWCCRKAQKPAYCGSFVVPSRI